MPAPQQIELPYVSLDFPGRTVLTLAEIAERIGFCERQILNLVDSGELDALDGASKGASRRALRIVAESYRGFVFRRLTGSHASQVQFLQQLPKETLKGLLNDITSILAA
jgi:hypothetical protein